MKLTKRKGFNFFRSYFDVYNELNDEDKLAFIDALLNRQFLGEKPKNLKGMVKFAYISQTNSIDSQVKGYEDKTKTRLDGSLYEKNKETPKDASFPPPPIPPTEPPTQGVKPTPTEQVEEKEKEKEKGEEEEEEKIPDDVLFSVEKLRYKYLQDQRIVKSVCDQNNITEDYLKTRLTDFNKHLESLGVYSKKWSDYTSHFLNWNKKAPKEITNLTDAEKHKAWLSKTISF